MPYSRKNRVHSRVIFPAFRLLSTSLAVSVACSCKTNVCPIKSQIKGVKEGRDQLYICGALCLIEVSVH